MGSPFLSVIIPAHNEEARIVSTLDRLHCYLSGQSFSWDVLVVDNRSSDSTPELVSDWAQRHEGFRLETIPDKGKGWAVKHGMLASLGKYRFMCDADLATPIEHVAEFLAHMEKGYDIVIGSRQIAGARRFSEPALRHIMGRAFNRAVRVLAIDAFQDTQCGFKCFRGEVADDLFRFQRIGGFGFDVEILYLALKRGHSVVEIPVDWYHQRESKVRPGLDSLLMLRDAAMVRWRDLWRGYEESPVAAWDEESSTGSTIRSERQPGGPVAVVVPTYNESRNLPVLADRVFALKIPNTRLIVVDDNSPDGTSEVARGLSKKFDGKVELIQRQRKQGLGTAYIEGFSRALADGAENVLQMDADLSHAPEYIPALLDGLRHADVVVGSRYVTGGGVDPGWSLNRRLLSYFGNICIRTVAGLRVKDATSGFKAFRGSALRSLGLTRLRCKGFGFQSEVAQACQRQGYTVTEYPIVFVDRTEGQSKMSLFIVFEAVWRLLLLRFRR